MKKAIFGLFLIIAICFAFIACDDDDESDYQGTYNVYGYYHHLAGEVLPWYTLTDSSFDTLKESSPTKFVLNSNSIIITGGLYDGQTFSARTNGNILYVTIDGAQIIMGFFISGDFRMTYGLLYASEGAYVLYDKL